MTNTRLILLTTLVGLTGCTAADEGEVDTTAQGVCTYQDATTDQGGNPRAPARPPAQTMAIELQVDGNGTLDGLQTDCVDGLTGSFEGLFEGEAELAGDGTYVAGLASATAVFETPGGCDIPAIDIDAVSRVSVRASLPASDVNCDGYCAARARAAAEAECGAEPTAIACRAAAEADYQASCSAACTVDQRRLVAETELQAAAVAELSARNLSGAALGDLDVDLEFDRIEDVDGNVIVEAP